MSPDLASIRTEVALVLCLLTPGSRSPTPRAPSMIKKIRRTLFALAAAAALCAVIPDFALGGPVSAANTTIFGPNVYVFDASMPPADIQGTAAGIFSKMESNQFGPERFALLFKPGEYGVTFDVGFYTQVAGLGQNPD